MCDEIIRVLCLDDYAELLALWRRAGLGSIRPSGRDSRSAVGRQLDSGVMTILGLEVGGCLAGAVIATHDSRKGWINRLAVDTDYRRRGYGLRLVEAAEAVLREQGMAIIAILIESGNEASFALFEQAGYLDAGPDVHYLTKRDSAGA
jgi:ribosomal protein S18 acetylase RimI-like enzyme